MATITKIEISSNGQNCSILSQKKLAKWFLTRFLNDFLLIYA
jgi:hypothetical protein